MTQIYFALEGEHDKVALDTCAELQHCVFRGMNRMISKIFYFVLLPCSAPGWVTMFLKSRILSLLKQLGIRPRSDMRVPRIATNRDG